MKIASATGCFNGDGALQTARFAAAFGAGNGPATGVVQQSANAVAGQAYALVLDYGTFQTLASGSAAQSLGVAIVDLNRSHTILTDAIVDASGTNVPSARFSTHAFRFEAVGTQTTMSFTDFSTFTFARDGILDNVAMSAVPEPGSWALMAAGLAGLAGWARRRTTASRPH